jgi:hypothetical protein
MNSMDGYASDAASQANMIGTANQCVREPDRAPVAPGQNVTDSVHTSSSVNLVRTSLQRSAWLAGEIGVDATLWLGDDRFG